MYIYIIKTYLMRTPNLNPKRKAGSSTGRRHCHATEVLRLQLDIRRLGITPS